ncbi:hypothetical protein [Desulfoscipio geothermicus]|uniref:Uncharacterized protein n=1 Tax=Desulfoscipio geothermicus DSM 3669 TaxID=1121426 RepID=A0A1I6DP79_9FIRM|nr:hypothetical protein [Desulfoscipio geothermicus]SFR07235.1 hypothetical protein SAMN05660706_11466 [Desulfoscipio geothermicus DSM 3669]
MDTNDKKSGNRKANIQMRFSDFDLPPMQDVLLIGKRAPIGPEAVRRMVDALAPGQYEVIPVENSQIEAMAVKSSLFNWMSRDTLINTILEEGIKLVNDKSIIKATLEITISIYKEVDV